MSQTLAATILRIASIAMIAFGALWALAPYDPVSTPAVLLIDILDWPLDGNPSEFSRYDQWFSAVATSFLFGLALLFLLLVCPLIEQGSKLARRAGIISLSVWFLSDCLGSYAAGVPVNVVWNIGFILPFIIPLVLVRLDEPAN